MLAVVVLLAIMACLSGFIPDIPVLQEMRKQEAHNVAQAMLVSRLYAERNISPSFSGSFDPVDSVPMAHRQEYRTYDLSGWASNGTIYIYSERGSSLILKELSLITDRSLNIGLVRETKGGHVIEPDAGVCSGLSAGELCSLPAPSSIPSGSIVAVSGSGN